MTNQTPASAPVNPLQRFLSEEQDLAVVQQVIAKVRQILTQGEDILYIGVQKPMVSLSPDCVVLTNKRFIVYRPTLLGGANFQDHIWRDLCDAHLSEGIMRSTITMKTTKGTVLSLGDLPKAQARKIYAFAQGMEEQVLEERRQREMEERRAAAGGVIFHGSVPTPPPAPPAQDDPLQKLKKLKDMADAGLITAQEYEAKKADILSRM